jgi:squalene-hopene/tetraprenyl-beta-curcumene cyclase
MSLIAAGHAQHPVVRKGVEFLEASVLADGSWPIDTNLATWVTTLSVNALGERSAAHTDSLDDGDRASIRQWLLGQQYRVEHPYTHAAPGGWAWTDLSGGVPDADDTPGALLAMRRLGKTDEAAVKSACAGLTWLLDLQNRDGGMPTFCRGWGALPFDRSSADLTAHAVLAWNAWRDVTGTDLRPRIDAATARALDYLMRTQRADGAWAPLWFGNQHAAEVANLTYGTSRVIRLGGVAHPTVAVQARWRESLARGVSWLCEARNGDGGWGGRAATPSSIEETALAVEGLAVVRRPGGFNDSTRDRSSVDKAIRSGSQWLCKASAGGREFPPAPIGFYFANLWYFERLYPLVFCVAALSRCRELAVPMDPA